MPRLRALPWPYDLFYFIICNAENQVFNYSFYISQFWLVVFLVHKFLACGGLWWLVVACAGLWWLVVACGGLWWLVVACGGSCVVLDLTMWNYEKLSAKFSFSRVKDIDTVGFLSFFQVYSNNY